MLHPTGAPRTLLLTAGEHRLLRAPSGSRWYAARGDARHRILDGAVAHHSTWPQRTRVGLILPPSS